MVCKKLFSSIFPFQISFSTPKILTCWTWVFCFSCRISSAEMCFIFLIFCNLPIFLLLSLFLSRSRWPGSSFGHCSRVQSHSSSMSGQPAHSLLRACQFLCIFCQWWWTSDWYQPLRLLPSLICIILRPLSQCETSRRTLVLYDILKGKQIHFEQISISI